MVRNKSCIAFCIGLFLSCNESYDAEKDKAGILKIHNLKWPKDEFCNDFLCEEAFGVEHMNVYDTNKINAIIKYILVNCDTYTLKRHKYYDIHIYRYDSLGKHGLHERLNWHNDLNWRDFMQLMDFHFAKGKLFSLDIFDNEDLIEERKKI